MSTNIKPIISLHALSFMRDKAAILKDVSLDVGAGKIFCLLGRSGSGKTTLLRIIAGLLSPKTGKVEINGLDQVLVPPYRRDIGFVFQDPGALLPHLTVFENIAFPFKVGRARPENKDLTKLVNSSMEAVGLTAFSTRFPKQLSGGEKQRVALARALVYEPAILLLDEPLASLDNISKEQLLLYISDLHKGSQATYIYVTHDEREAFRLADQIGILADGQLQQIGTPSELINDPFTGEIAKLTGAWNLLPVNCEPQAKIIILPPGSNPSTLPLLVENSNNEIHLGFAIRSVKIAFRPVSDPAQFLSLTGTVQDVYVQNHTMVVLVRIQSSLIKVSCPFDGKIPSTNDTVTCLIEKDKIKQYPE